jgi:hypothetical protein
MRDAAAAALRITASNAAVLVREDAELDLLLAVVDAELSLRFPTPSRLVAER